jgi:hypothetical protein
VPRNKYKITRVTQDDLIGQTSGDWHWLAKKATTSHLAQAVTQGCWTTLTVVFLHRGNVGDERRHQDEEGRRRTTVIVFFFFARKAVDERWGVVAPRPPPSVMIQQRRFPIIRGDKEQ